ncbi:MAG: PAS domain S-box protein [Spirochaetes bacterium]|nr:MAG: PAS domain S-box protein [Spirochaetota bacterium]
MKQDKNPGTRETREISLLRARIAELEEKERTLRLEVDAIRNAERQYHALVSFATDLIYITDIYGHFTFVNPASAKVTGYAKDELLGRHFSSIIMPAYRDSAREFYIKQFKDKTSLTYYEVPILTKTGVTVWLGINTQLTVENGTLIGYQAIARDITERKKTEDALRLSEEKFRLIYEESPIGIELYDRDGDLLEINRACREIFGVAEKESVAGFRLWDDPNLPGTAKERLLLGETVRFEAPFSFETVKEHRLYQTVKSGTIHLDVLITPLGGKEDNALSGYLVQVQDITERKEYEEKLKHLSMHDALTGLYNRAYFEQEMIRLDKGRNLLMGMILCDVDGLKLVNDTMGHDKGDELIRVAAATIAAGFRAGDMVARIGGDEFAVILPGCSEENVIMLRERLKNSIGEYNSVNPSIPLSFSVGTACRSSVSVTMEELFREADESMYSDKRSHRDVFLGSLEKFFDRLH